MNLTKLKYSEVLVVEPNNIKYYLVLRKDPSSNLDDGYGFRWSHIGMDIDFERANGMVEQNIKWDNEQHERNLSKGNDEYEKPIYQYKIYMIELPT